jgi:Coenzyme PQQ synthesis protein D (PqqD)
LANWDEQRLTAPEHVMFRELDGEAVLLNLQNEMYYGLDEVGTRMWTLLTTSDSVQAAMDAMLEEFDVTPEILEQDVAKMIKELQTNGLLETVDE